VLVVSKKVWGRDPKSSTEDPPSGSSVLQA